MRIQTSLGSAALALASAFGLLTAQPALASGTGAAPVVPPASGTGAICWYGACYNYVSGRQMTDTSGASVKMFQADPKLDTKDPNAHSLQEVALQDTARKSTVEVGWTVDQSTNGDLKPHLFVYHWVDGQTSCYNACGFVQVSKHVKPGMAVRAGAAGEFGIRNINGDWWILYNHQKVGYFPGSLWNGAYTRAQVVTAFGEVSATTGDTCTEMGDGRFGSARHSSWIRDYQIYGSADAPHLTVSDTSPTRYDFGSVTATSFQLGGPGYSTC